MKKKAADKKPGRPKTMTVTERQEELANYARAFVKDNGRFPTLREAATELGVTNNAVRNKLDALIAKGVIVKVMRSYKFVA